MSERVLVTGGTGFLGSGLVAQLLERECEVIVLDNESRGSESRLGDLSGQYTMINGDVGDPDIVREASRGVSTIFHLAYVNGTKFFYSRPDEVLRVALEGILRTVAAARECGAKKFILASSSEVYQSPTVIPTTEDERLIVPDVKNPRFSYSGGKIASELVVLNFFRSLEQESIIFRPHNVFGPNMGFEHVVPEIVEKLYKASDRFTKASCEIDIQGSGGETRAFCYVDIAVEQIMFLYDHGNDGEIYNIGVEAETKVSELVYDIGRILDLEVQIRPGPARLGATNRRCPSIQKLTDLGYRQVTPNSYLRGLTETVEWYKHYFLTNGTPNTQKVKEINSG